MSNLRARANGTLNFWVVCLVTAFMAAGSASRVAACGGSEPDGSHVSYMLPSTYGIHPVGAAPLYVADRPNDYGPAVQSLPYGTEVSVSRQFTMSDGHTQIAAIRVIATGKEAFVRADDVSPFRFWECSPEDLFRWQLSRAPQYFASLPMAWVRTAVTGTERRNPTIPVSASQITAGIELMCESNLTSRAQRDPTYADCYNGKLDLSVLSSALRIVTPAEMAARMPATALTHVGCSYRRVDGFVLNSAVGETGYLLPRLPWTDHGSKSLFEMVGVFKRIGPTVFQQTGYLPYGSRVSVEEHLGASNGLGMYRVKEQVEGQEFFVDPRDVKLFPVWQCDIAVLLEDAQAHKVPRIVDQVPVRIKNREAQALDYYRDTFVDGTRLAAIDVASCDLYDPTPSSTGQKRTRCTAPGLTFTIDPSALEIIDPSSLPDEP